MSKINFEYTGDDFVDYLKKMQELLHDKSNTRSFLKDTAYEMHNDYIALLMPEWNPNLINSPAEARHQLLELGDELSTIELVYSGYTKQHDEYGLTKIFKRFARDGDTHSGKLDRDYAYYQETGIDAKMYGATWNGKPYRPTHLHFIRRGTDDYTPVFHERTLEYLDRILNLQRWERKQPQLFVYDYE